jgi:hypothetical protein
MNGSKITQIKNIVAKIDIEKINGYLQEYPKSKTLRRIVGYSKRVLDSSNDQETFKLGTYLAYDLDTICDAEKTGYVKDEAEKKYWLELSEELFKQTIGVK